MVADGQDELDELYLPILSWLPASYIHGWKGHYTVSTKIVPFPMAKPKSLVFTLCYTIEKY